MATAGKYRAIQERDPMKALGRAVDHFMRQPNFAPLPFGHWAQILAGQINRRHYFFVVEGEKIVGFAGWALALQPLAEAWLANERDLTGEESKSGDCMIINAWQADRTDINKFIIQQLRAAGKGLKMVYAKRYYADGHWRPVKLTVDTSMSPDN